MKATKLTPPPQAQSVPTNAPKPENDCAVEVSPNATQLVAKETYVEASPVPKSRSRGKAANGKNQGRASISRGPKRLYERYPRAALFFVCASYLAVWAFTIIVGQGLRTALANGGDIPLAMMALTSVVLAAHTGLVGFFFGRKVLLQAMAELRKTKDDN